MPIREENAGPVERVRSTHALCALKGAVSLIAGREIMVPGGAYRRSSPTRLGRLFQVGNGAVGILANMGRPSTLISGKTLAYRGGEVEYFAEDKLNHWRSYKKLTHPFFVVPGTGAKAIAEATGCDLVPTPRLYIKQFQCTVVVIANRGGLPAVMHYATCGDSAAEIGRMVEGLGIAAAESWIQPLTASLLAHQILPGGATVLAQSRIPADPFRFSWRRIDTANELWFEGHPANSGRGRVQLDARLDLVCGYFSQFRDLLTQAADALRAWCEEARLPAGLAHGDFWLGNVLFKGDRVVGIIDWEWARRDGLPLADNLNMLLRVPSIERKRSFAETLRQFWSDDMNDAELTARIAGLRSRSGMGIDDLKFVGLILWFDVLWQRAFKGIVESANWLDNMIPQTAPVILRWLGRRGKSSH